MCCRVSDDVGSSLRKNENAVIISDRKLSNLGCQIQIFSQSWAAILGRNVRNFISIEVFDVKSE